jgi:CHAT domain-containing protein
MSELGPSALLRELSALPRQARAGELRAHGDAERLLIALGDEAEKMVVAQVGSALASAELLVALADEMELPAAQARARRALGQALAYSGKFEQALKVCNAAASIAEDAGETVQAARAKLSSIHALGEMGRYAEAVEAGECAWRMLSGAGEPAFAARADLNLGVIYRKWDQPRKAIEHFDRARPGLANETMILAQLDSNRGEALLALDDLRGAEAAFRHALLVFEREGHRWGAAIVEGNLADLAVRQGQFDRAIYHFESARRHLESDASTTHLARILVEQGDAKAALGMFHEAMADYQAALPVLDEHHQPADAARARAGLAPIMVRLGRLSDADHALADALAQYESLNQSSAQARLLLVRSELAELRGQRRDAAAMAERALSLSSERPIDAARATHRLAALALEGGELAEAESQAARALSVAEEAGITPLIADLRHLRGTILSRKGDLNAAVRELRLSVGALERIRGSLQAERFRAAFLGDRLAAYESLFRAILERGGTQAAREALEVAEMAKSRALGDIIRGALPPPSAAAAADGGALAAEHAGIQAELNSWYRRLEPGMVDDAWRERARILEEQLSSLEARLDATQRISRGLNVEENPLAAIQRVLHESDLLIEYFAADRKLFAFTVTRRSIAVAELSASVSDVNDLVRRVQFQIGRALRPGALEGSRAVKLEADAREALERLYDAVIRPIERDIRPGARLIIVPHGSLHGAPFAALSDGRKYLIEEHEIVSAPAGGLYAHLAGRTFDPAGKAVVISVADELAPRIQEEAAEVARMLQPEQWLRNEDANVSSVASAVAGAGIVHFACHGRFDSRNPLGSGLRMHDGWLTVRDAYRLQMDGTLLVLSACETGQSHVSAGDELAGLLRGMFAAGASAALVALWLVEDNAALELMRSFYHRLRDRDSAEGPAQALRRAQLELLHKSSHPAQWAPFLLVGAT